MKVQECGTSKWDEGQHGLRLPHSIATIDFCVTGKGHERIEPLYRTYCDRGRCTYTIKPTMPEDRIAA